ncbi:MAG: hypothetical protein GXO76_06710 [Calditrichaeota bacterium]|nr:hypothetical protein [Calditrichota bacterium]
MTFKQLSLIAGIFLVLAWTNCSKKDTPTGPKENQNPPALTIQAIDVPQHMRASSDPHAQMSTNFIGMANSFSSLSAAFTPPAGLAKNTQTLDDPIWTKSWKYNGVTLTMSVYDRNDMNVWEIRFDGADEDYTYKNWLFMKIEQSKDGKSGTMTTYEPVTTKIQAQWSWGKDAEGAYSITYLLEEGDEGIKLIVTQNSDNSGSLQSLEKYNGSFVPSYESHWDSGGVGSWKQFENGKEIASGSWG